MCLNYSKVVSLNVKGRPFEFLLAGSGRFRQLMSMIPHAIPATWKTKLVKAKLWWLRRVTHPRFSLRRPPNSFFKAAAQVLWAAAQRF